jgi:uncharacterized membrane protein YbhN (UPF0104 family)
MSIARGKWWKVGAYAIAVALIWYAARGAHVADVLAALSKADVWLFVPVSFAGFLMWFFGETLLFARLFSYFHKPTRFRELLSANAAQYFLQLANVAVASAALIVFLNRRKGVSWSTAGLTLMFQGLLDFALLAALSLLAVCLGLNSPLTLAAPFAAAVLAAGTLVALSLRWWRPKLRAAKWLYELPSLSTFRAARLSHYLRLSLIRVPIFLAEGLVLYGQLRSFHINISFVQATLFSPVALLVGSLPLAPAGLGTTQLVFVKGLARFAPGSDLLAASLAISFISLLWRLPLALVVVRSVARDQAATTPQTAPRNLERDRNAARSERITAT